ncbi:histidine kinase [Spirillospora sp. NPDC052269]
MNTRPPLLKRLTWRQLVAVDVLAAVVLLAAGRPTDAQLARNGLSAELCYVLLAMSAGAVAIRRPWPFAALGTSLAAYLGLALHGFAKFPTMAVALVLYLVAASRPRGRALTALVVTELAVGLGCALAASSGAPGSLSFGADWRDLWFGQSTALLGFWTTGFMLRTQRRYERHLQAQAERSARDRIEEARRTVTRERMRIARELHDVVAHSMSVIAVQAGVGHHVAGARPDEAAKALAAIETTSRSALREMRGLLSVLREETMDDTAEPFLATPGLADLERLAEQTEQATGLRVELRIDGDPGELPPARELAGYRIVQEALTNVVKHADTDRVRVRIVRRETDMEIEVTDEGTGPPGGETVTSGHGLVGMRERVALYGGEFSAGPRPLGGFRVWARLPIGGAE